MVGMNGTNGIGAYQTQTEISRVSKVNAIENTTKDFETKNANYGRTVGNPKLSEKGQKYYEELKKKFGNYDFVLVSKDEMEKVKANPAKYANSLKTTVLIDEEKIEKMATDEKFRKQYEGILSGAAAKLEELKSNMEKMGANVKGYGMQLNDNGTVSYFAVLRKSSAEQKERIEKNIEEKRAKRHEDEKKAFEKHNHPLKKEEEVSFIASNVDELMKKIEDFTMSEKSDIIQTDEEKALGQNIDFRG